MCGITLHDECFRVTPACLVDLRKQLPHLVVHGAQCIGTLGADESRIRLPVMQQVLCGEYIRVPRIPARRAIGGELREKVVVKRFALHACEKIVKECGGSTVVLPKYAEIVCHVAFLPLVQTSPNHCGRAARIAGQRSPLFAIARTISRARG